jgi:hypothetical protein
MSLVFEREVLVHPKFEILAMFAAFAIHDDERELRGSRMSGVLRRAREGFRPNFETDAFFRREPCGNFALYFPFGEWGILPFRTHPDGSDLDHFPARVLDGEEDVERGYAAIGRTERPKRLDEAQAAFTASE